MKTNHTPYPLMIAIVLAMAGFFDSLYLFLSRLKPDSVLACPVGGGCEVVQASRWSTLPPGDGMPVALIGVIGYVVLFILGMVALHKEYLLELPTAVILLVVVSGGLLFSIYLMTIQLVILKTICFWCAMSAIFELAIWIAALVNWRLWVKRRQHI